MKRPKEPRVIDIRPKFGTRTRGMRRTAAIIFMRDAEIAKILSIKLRLVEKYVDQLLRHFDVNTRTAVAFEAARAGWIDWEKLDNYRRRDGYIED